jgi:hypothetical protein
MSAAIASVPTCLSGSESMGVGWHWTMGPRQQSCSRTGRIACTCAMRPSRRQCRVRFECQSTAKRRVLLAATTSTVAGTRRHRAALTS